jgi:PAS domain S-box-containing protein
VGVFVSLRLKTALIIAGILLVAMVVLYVGIGRLLYDQAARIERDEVRTDLARVTAAIDYHGRSLDGKLSDWSSWDDSYRWVVDQNAAYARSNLLPDCFESLQVNTIVFLDTRDHIVWGRMRTLHEGGLRPLPPALLRELRPGSPILDVAPEEESSRVGLVVCRGDSGALSCPGGVMLMAARPILTSAGQGPSRGTLVMGRWLDAEEIGLLAGLLRFKVVVARLDRAMPAGFEVPAGFLLDVRAGGARAPLSMSPVSETTMAGFVPLTGVSGRPVAIARMTKRRDAHIQASRGMGFLAGSLGLVWLLAVGAVWTLTDRVVLSRVSALSRGVKVVGESGDLAVRVGQKEPLLPDELTDLSNEINSTLYALEESKAALQESERRFRSVVDQASDMIFLVDPETRAIIQANEAFYTALGYKPGKPSKLTMDAILPEGEAAADWVERAYPGAANVAETAYRRKDGSLAPVEEAANVVNSAGREVVGVVARDITDRQQVERLREDFSALVSHELRSPLTSIMGFAAVLDRLLEPDADERTRLAVTRICDKAREMSRMIEELMNFAKARDGRLAPMLQQTDLGEVVRLRVEGMPSSPKHQVFLEIAQDLSPVACDPDLIGYVVTNLVSNAMKYSPDGGKITVAVRTRAGRAAIVVSDQGMGIPKDDLGRIFDRFSQSEAAGERRRGGIGLGLYVSREIVRAHNGYIDVKSKPGKGSKFTVDIPIAGEAHSPASEA